MNTVYATIGVIIRHFKVIAVAALAIFALVLVVQAATPDRYADYQSTSSTTSDARDAEVAFMTDVRDADVSGPTADVPDHTLVLEGYVMCDVYEMDGLTPDSYYSNMTDGYFAMTTRADYMVIWEAAQDNLCSVY